MAASAGNCSFFLGLTVRKKKAEYNRKRTIEWNDFSKKQIT